MLVVTAPQATVISDVAANCAAGKAFIVKVTGVLVKLEQVPLDVCPYKIRVAATVLTRVAGVTTLPPVAASYQMILDPEGTVAVAVKVCDEPVSHTVIFTGAVGAGVEITVILPVAVPDGQPPSVVTV